MQGYPFWSYLNQIISGETGTSQAGFPIISEESFQVFLDKIPHLFQNGLKLKNVLTQLESQNELSDSERRAIKVLHTVVHTACITAPSDLWLLKQIVSTYKELEIEKDFLSKKWFTPEGLGEKYQLNTSQLIFDLDFIHSRGYLEKRKGEYKISGSPQATELFEKLLIIPEHHPRNMIPSIVSFLKGSDENQSLMEEFFEMKSPPKAHPGWVAGIYEIAVGYRLVPLVLSLRFMELTSKLKSGEGILTTVPRLNQKMTTVLHLAGVIDDSGKVTTLGGRLFARGPGPFGIIHAYHGYLKHHRDLLKGDRGDIWVARGENVAASQDANSKTFKMINDKLDQFCSDTGFEYNVFIEHAVGQGEASRQRYQRDQRSSIGRQYFGADLEDSAIDKALEAKERGELPSDMKFVRQADIGKPEILIAGLKKEKADTTHAVMVVGNGFHEVRDQTNEKMIEVFKIYCQSKIIIIFTEESGLSDEDLLFTGWNTYHAGFRYCHEISGQGLRPAFDNEDDEGARYSWRKCAGLGGYRVLKQYTSRTRTIYPHPRKDGYNPAISVNYFCVPEELAEKLIKK